MDTPTWLADYQRRIDDIAARATTAQRALAGLAATATSEHGEVTVAVDPAGALVHLTFGERSEELTRPQLASVILDTARKAQLDAARRCREALAPIIGESAADHFIAGRPGCPL